MLCTMLRVGRRCCIQEGRGSTSFPFFDTLQVRGLCEAYRERLRKGTYQVFVFTESDVWCSYLRYKYLVRT